MIRSAICIALALAALAGSAAAQQAPPPSYNPTVDYMVAPDGSIFQMLTSTGAYDETGTRAAYAAYVASHPQPAMQMGHTLVTKLGFIRLLSSTERGVFVAAMAQANALTPAQMASPTPSQQALMGLQVFMMEYNALQPGDTINLTDPDTASAVSLFLTLGIVTSQARVTAILAGQAPSP
jgi:hypothetical protein